MLGMLADLDNCAPGVWSELLLTVVALRICLDEFNQERLLNELLSTNLFGNRQLNFDAL
jgi:hypothetical protein